MQECAAALGEEIGEAIQTASSLRQAVNRLRSEEFEAVVIDQFLLEVEADETDLVLHHAGSAIPIFVNFAISGVPRLAREVRTALCRRRREEQVARKAAEESLRNEFKGTLTALLLSCEMALEAPDLPSVAVDKIKTVYEIGREMRLRLGMGEEALADGG